MKKTTNGVTVRTTQDGHIEVLQPSIVDEGTEAFVTLTPDDAVRISEWLVEAATEARRVFKPK